MIAAPATRCTENRVPHSAGLGWSRAEPRLDSHHDSIPGRARSPSEARFPEAGTASDPVSPTRRKRLAGHADNGAARVLVQSTLLAGALLASPLIADSDGYFCIGPAYLAYEVGIAGQSVHELRVVSLKPPLSEASLHAMRLPDFQVHDLSCEAGEVLVLGWEHLYTVSISGDGSLSDLRSEKLPHRGDRPGPFAQREAASNLGSLAQERVLPLDSHEANFFLVTRLSAAQEECELRVVSSLQEADHEGLLRFELPLYSGRRGSDCGP